MIPRIGQKRGLSGCNGIIIPPQQRRGLSGCGCGENNNTLNGLSGCNGIIIPPQTTITPAKQLGNIFDDISSAIKKTQGEIDGAIDKTTNELGNRLGEIVATGAKHYAENNPNVVRNATAVGGAFALGIVATVFGIGYLVGRK